jgi:hypothetical protein
MSVLVKCEPRSPDVRQLLERRGNWELREDLIVLDGYRNFRVPAGFIFDYASVPRIVRPLIQSTDLSTAPPAAHDWLYRNGGRVHALTGELLHYQRHEADRLLYELAEECKVPRWRRWLAWKACARFGAGAWGRSKPQIRQEEVA